MYKKIIIFFILLILIAGSSFAIWKNNEKPNDEEKINSKLNSEMEYLNTSLISIANGLNNIVIQEYKITESSNNNTSSESSNNTSKNDNSSKEN